MEVLGAGRCFAGDGANTGTEVKGICSSRRQQVWNASEKQRQRDKAVGMQRGKTEEIEACAAAPGRRIGPL